MQARAGLRALHTKPVLRPGSSCLDCPSHVVSPSFGSFHFIRLTLLRTHWYRPQCVCALALRIYAFRHPKSSVQGGLVHRLSPVIWFPFDHPHLHRALSNVLPSCPSCPFTCSFCARARVFVTLNSSHSLGCRTAWAVEGVARSWNAINSRSDSSHTLCSDLRHASSST